MTMPTQKEAPAELSLDEGEDPNPTEGEEIMSTVTVHPDVAKVFAALDELPADMYLILEADDPFYTPIADERVRPVSDFVKSAEDLDQDVRVNGLHHWCTFYEPDGRVVPKGERDDAWYEVAYEGIPKRDLWTIIDTPNATMRLANGVLLVSQGRWQAFEHTTLDGAPAIRFVTPERLKQIRVQEEREWLAAHPQFEAVKPEWARGIGLLHDEEQRFCVQYSRSYGPYVSLSQVAFVDGDGVRFDDGGLELYVSGRVEEIRTANDLRSLAIAAADAARVMQGFEGFRKPEPKAEK